MTGTNKEAQLQEALESDNPVTDLPIAVEVDYFRLAKTKYFVPISVRIPGSALSFRNKGAKAATELDFIGEILDAHSTAGFGGARHDSAECGRDHGRAKSRASRSNTIPDLRSGPGKYTLEVRGAGERRGQDRHVRIAICGSGSGLGERAAPELGDPEQPGAGREGTDRGREEQQETGGGGSADRRFRPEDHAQRDAGFPAGAEDVGLRGALRSRPDAVPGRESRPGSEAKAPASPA